MWARKAASGHVKDFTEATRRTIQFAANMQQASAASGCRSTSIRYMRPLSGHATRRRRRASIFMTNSPRHAKRAGGVCFSSPFSTNVPGNAFFPSRSSRNGDGAGIQNTFQDRELANDNPTLDAQETGFFDLSADAAAQRRL